jgi:predicted MFS family arabinose efflux permease
VIALAVIAVAFHSPTERLRHAIDYRGAVLLGGALSAVVLFTSLGGTTWAWSSWQVLGLMVLSLVLVPAFVLAERRAAEPILPLSLFRNRIFSATGAVAFVVGFALFGAITYLPLYLQVTKNASPTESGLQLVPLMGGVLLTSIATGQLITRLGRYRVFPIVGTAVMVVAMLLLSRLGVATQMWVVSLDSLVLGLGLGMTMQVLVLAAQNSVDRRMMGVATSGSTLFRQIGGSIGVAVFGTIFANRLDVELAQQLPPGAARPATLAPATIRHLPAGIHGTVVDAYALALHPVFLAAAGVSVIAFLLAWLVRDAPLRTHAAEAA